MDIQAKKVVVSGTGPKYAEAAYGKFYIAEDGSISPKAPEGKYTIGAEVLYRVTIPAMDEDLIALAVEHSFTRKLQEKVQAWAKGEVDPQTAADGFFADYASTMRHEKAEKAVAAKVDTPQGLALKNLTRFHALKAGDMTGKEKAEQVAFLKGLDKEAVKAAKEAAQAEMAGNTANWKKALKRAEAALAQDFE